MKHVYLRLIFLICFYNQISGGNGGSDQSGNGKQSQKTDSRVEKAVKEMNHHLSKITHTCKTRAELDEHLKSLINKDVPNPKLFPILNTLMADEANQNDPEFIALLKQAVELSLKAHADTKSKELKLT